MRPIHPCRTQEATRTLDLILGFGVPAATDAPFMSVLYAADQIRTYVDTYMLPVNASWQPPLPNVVYHGMDWDCPGWTRTLADQLRKLHGNITAAETMRR